MTSYDPKILQKYADLYSQASREAIRCGLIGGLSGGLVAFLAGAKTFDTPMTLATVCVILGFVIGLIMGNTRLPDLNY
ncbi:hypothetical protein SBA4_2510028 [Candidatus Sulfopaludibacter sp. SbA4]|nr:hypothetical protein SBA4_2510028 [Candidatus Sulfopaludibacter sp. SbA4]